ncbi:glutamyl-tRNA synthetase [Clostridium cavendishii DSM 21758]|uniref:Glutamate--tRNA ligase n=1 Tax=Clostridium cavendishii DSM 21758 TaxID=1121302 RepID=A0A1M6JF81_9CLOT|nr:glutamate--tRNA ligase [Clostridium cavendishii]SHJ45348.1 glutamyl-tRNA synthetase [Clostridium cavendishii DSM 21758]
MSYKDLAEKIFKDVTETPEFFLEKYKKRELKEGAMVTRYAPSPTGFQHIGGVFAALIAERLAVQSGGVFYLRVEDTDQKREVVGAIEDTINTMKHFGMNFSEGMTGEDTEIGNYGPYRQSKRAHIYNAFAKSLIEKGLAYPCFCSAEELTKVREEQVENKITPGYYGEYAKCRNLSPEEAIAKIEAGEPYILRLKSPGNFETRVNFHDLIKGDISFPENNVDIVLIKSDGLPTYHFAHAIDDALMGTTHVTRGEEWLSSLPIHVQLFEVLGFEVPKHAHFPSIMKLENGNKRKLSKRKDPESAVTYYKEEGYPVASVVEYLLNLINSTFEVWREENPNADYHDFVISLDKMSKSGSLFDIVKLNDVSKNVICKFPATRVYEEYKTWAEEYDKEMFDLIVKYKERTIKAFNIDKEGPKPRKDFAKWTDVKEKVFFFYDELFDKETLENVELPKNMDIEEAKRIAKAYVEIYDENDDNEAWFGKVKELAISLGYTADRKAFKKNPEEFKGMVSDVAGAIRSVVAHRTNTPDLHTIMHIMGSDMVTERFAKFLNL